MVKEGSHSWHRFTLIQVFYSSLCIFVKSARLKVTSMRTIRGNKLLFILVIFLPSVLKAQEKQGASAEELANKLSNPVASLIIVPFKIILTMELELTTAQNTQWIFGRLFRSLLTRSSILITRYIIPIVDQHDITGEGEDQFGLGDATISGFFSPGDSKNGWIGEQVRHFQLR